MSPTSKTGDFSLNLTKSGYKLSNFGTNMVSLRGKNGLTSGQKAPNFKNRRFEVSNRRKSAQKSTLPRVDFACDSETSTQTWVSLSQFRDETTRNLLLELIASKEDAKSTTGHIMHQRPSHVVFPKIGISCIFWDFTQKLGFQAKYMDFRCPWAPEIPKKAPWNP